jgi:branched-chain amino acid aminotransferase
MLAYLNGRFLPQEEAGLSLHDAGFVFGATVTDFCRTFQHRLFRVQDHVARFRQSCKLARIPQPIPNEEITLMAEELTSRNVGLLKPEQDLVLIMFATPGPVAHYAGQGNSSGPTLGMHTFPLPKARYAPLFQDGAHMVVPATRQVPTSSIDPRIKHRSRLHWWIASQEAQEIEKGTWALLLDTNGYVTDTAAASFLIAKDGTVYSPPRSSILAGISLQTTEEICRELGIEFRERPITIDDCRQADEALLTGTAFCLAGVSRINGMRIPWPGPLLEKLLQAWNQRVGLDIPAQILSEV